MKRTVKRTTPIQMRASSARRRKMQRKRRIQLLIIMAAVLLSIYGLLNRDRKNSIIPEKYRELLLVNSEKYQIPVEVLYGVIKTESNFDEKAVSSVGACGLMQLMPETFDWLQTVKGESFDAFEIFDPKINVDYGSSYLAMLYERFGNWDTVFAAYNAGPTIVSVWLQDSEDMILNNIPYSETDNYVKKVNLAIQEYRKH